MESALLIYQGASTMFPSTLFWNRWIASMLLCVVYPHSCVLWVHTGFTICGLCGDNILGGYVHSVSKNTEVLGFGHTESGLLLREGVRTVLCKTASSPSNRRRGYAVVSDLCPLREGVGTVLCKTASSPSNRRRGYAVVSDLCPLREGVGTVLCKTASSPSNRRRGYAVDPSRSRRAADISVLETDLPGGQYEIAEEFTEKLIEKAQNYIFWHDTGHPEYK